MNEELEKLIQKSLIRDIQIKLIESKLEGNIIDEEIINQILKDLEFK